MPLSDFLLENLRCPQSRKPLVLDGDRLVSMDEETRRAYKIEDDIPVMLIDESTELSREEWDDVMKKHKDQVEAHKKRTEAKG